MTGLKGSGTAVMDRCGLVRLGSISCGLIWQFRFGRERCGEFA